MRCLKYKQLILVLFRPNTVATFNFKIMCHQRLFTVDVCESWRTKCRQINVKRKYSEDTWSNLRYVFTTRNIDDTKHDTNNEFKKIPCYIMISFICSNVDNSIKRLSTQKVKTVLYIPPHTLTWIYIVIIQIVCCRTYSINMTRYDKSCIDMISF